MNFLVKNLEGLYLLVFWATGSLHEGTVPFMPCDFMDTGMYGAICNSATFTSVRRREKEYIGNIINVSPAFIPSLAKGESPAAYVKL
jgi:hypothetical protein